MNRVTSAVAIVVGVCLCVLQDARAFNIYLPPNSSWTDDDILVFGDGAPIYTTLGELHRTEPLAAGQVMRPARSTALQTLTAGVVKALGDACSNLEPLMPQIVPVPEPNTPALALVAVLLLGRRILRLQRQSRGRLLSEADGHH